MPTTKKHGTPEILSQQSLNRALLARQLLLERSTMGVQETVEHLVGMQAQEPFPPYFGLWTRLAGFDPAALSQLLIDRAVVRIVTIRGLGYKYEVPRT